MKHHYYDIRSRIAEPPLWWDEHGVPRYAAFQPGQVADIYARECALVEIACQQCETRFRVAFSRSSLADVIAFQRGTKPVTLADEIRGQTLHYGDPPNAGCCVGGATMNSEPLGVVEYWRSTKGEWERDPALEVPLTPPWTAHDVILGAAATVPVAPPRAGRRSETWKPAMKLNDYQLQALVTQNNELTYQDKVLMHALGLGECGEVQNIVKKAVFHNHGLGEDTQGKIADELGDILWYVACLADTLGYTLEDIAVMNISKLKRRYGEKFSSQASINREV